MKISNPDYPNNNYYLEFEYQGQNIQTVPFIYSSAPGYESYRGDGMGMYWVFRLLVIEKEGQKWKCKTKDGSPILLNPVNAWNYFKHIGFNTTYVIAPEEVLAENWCCLVQDQKPFKTPEVVQKLKNFLKKHQKKVPTP